VIRQIVCLAFCVSPVFGANCESLAGLALSQSTITLAQTVNAGEFTAPEAGGRGRGNGGNPYKDLPAFCRVAATLKPAADSDIKIEVWLPAEGWNGNFLAAGNGGGANAAIQGSINIPALAAALRKGYATAATDTGHEGATLSYAIRPSGAADRFRIPGRA
jgi:feruloyl esterase